MEAFIKIPGIAGVAFLLSCENVLDVELNGIDPKIVIEANISNELNRNEVKIYKTVNFDESNVFPAVIGASVSISDNTGFTEVLTEDSAGVFHTAILQAVSGQTYTLTVKAEGKEYRATSTMPAAVRLEGLDFEEMNGINDQSIVTIRPEFIDPLNTENYYHFVQTINGKRTKTTKAFDDTMINGLANFNVLTYSGLELQHNDLIVVEMRCIDKNVYTYLTGLIKMQENPASSMPHSNPVSNLTNGALGYFSAHTVSDKSLLILK
jgi:hypothetical protein